MAPYLDLSTEQLNVLLNFAASNPHLAFGRVNSNSDDQFESEFKWKELMRDINCLNPSTQRARGVKEYKAYWTKLKSKLSVKMNRARRQLNMSKKPAKLALHDYEIRMFNMMPKNAKDKFLVIEAIEDKNTSKNKIIIKQEPTVPFPYEDINKKVETVLEGLEIIADSIQNVARLQVELTKGQIIMAKGLNNMAEVFKKIKQNYSELYNNNHNQN
ncbi:uncharacterized protein LOC114354607 [Ostrinia furnacalis]|uniref:uncharacterized protein LOC114354607 n=1 Tax=Ostrinia furnacalis TaxID=93504 RepID=UPI00103C90D4|nr:uncharacterized protein LOC114354607 [Ostrinia furnacalis]